MRNKIFRKDLFNGISLFLVGILMIVAYRQFNLELSGGYWLVYSALAFGMVFAAVVWIIQQLICYGVHLKLRRSFADKTMQSRFLQLYGASAFQQQCYLSFCDKKELEELQMLFRSMDSKLEQKSVRASRFIYYLEYYQNKYSNQ